VRKVIKQTLIAVLFAVSMLGGSDMPILHAPAFADAHALVHQHARIADAGSVDPATDADHHDHDAPLKLPAPDDCTHSHAHCCGAMAILAAAAIPAPEMNLGLLRVERNAALPYGQLARPPLRPPRLSA
jgi:hypothetical protein